MKKFLMLIIFLSLPILQGCWKLLGAAAAGYGLYQAFK